MYGTHTLAFLASCSSVDKLTGEHWRLFDFHDVPRVKAIFGVLRASGKLAQVGEMAVFRALVRSCDPDYALLALQRWLEAGGTLYQPELPALSEESGISFQDLLCMLFAATPALSEYFVRFPARTRPILEQVLRHDIQSGRAWQQTIFQALKSANDHSSQLAVLRRERIECMLQIAALDLAGLAKLPDTTRALSHLADACIAAALEIALQKLRPRFGTLPARAAQSPDRPPFAVLALGKLGGLELNYSSDIDLVFVHAGSGESAGAARSVEAGAYFTALGEELLAALAKVTEDGRVYRVDMRLRPHGSAGLLVQHLADAVEYFHNEGRTWERQAWLKARPVAGDLALGRELLQKLEPFIFRRYLSLDAISDMQALKRQMELSVARRGESADEVKLGRGGIRDIEFTVQFLQLLHGSEHLSVRGGQTLRALYELRHEGLLADREAEPLVNAYLFLRAVEHRLQLHGDLQTHLLPQEPALRRRLARSLGYEDENEASGGADSDRAPRTAQEIFEADRHRHTTLTREVFERLFANLFRESTGVEGQLSDLLLAPEPDIQALAALLPDFGFANSESSARELAALGHDAVALTAPSHTRKFFASVAPQLLKVLAATGEPEDALRRFSRIAGSLGAKAVFYQMLNENRWLLKMTADLAAWSVYLTDVLVANPGLFDDLVNALQTGQSKSALEMAAELAQITGGGDIADTLRAYRAGELLRIGVRDLIHSASLEQTQRELTDLAEAILRVQLPDVQKAHRLRHGAVLDAANQPVQFAVLGLGKFGGREMNYGSDLDVLFFYGGPGQTGNGLPATACFIELAQDLTRAMARPTALGLLYELDARLRPNGSKGPLALCPDDFKRYWQAGQLADWERLALTRARFVAGDEGVAERALHVIRSAVYSPLKDTQSLAREVAAMRQRLENTADKGDLKRGRGGLVDVEFIAQYLQLIHGPALPPLRQANTEEALQALIKFKKLSAEDGAVLLNGYKFFRRMENRVRIMHGLSAHSLPQKPGQLRKLALRTGYADSADQTAEAALQAAYQLHTTKVRELFQKIVS